MAYQESMAQLIALRPKVRSPEPCTAFRNFPNELIDLIIEGAAVNDLYGSTRWISAPCRPSCSESSVALRQSVHLQQLRRLTLVSTHWRKKLLPHIYALLTIDLCPQGIQSCMLQPQCVFGAQRYTEYIQTVVLQNLGHFTWPKDLLECFHSMMSRVTPGVINLVFVESKVSYSCIRDMQCGVGLEAIEFVNCAVTTQGVNTLLGSLRPGGCLRLDNITLIPTVYMQPHTPVIPVYPASVVLRRLTPGVISSQRMLSLLGPWVVNVLELHLSRTSFIPPKLVKQYAPLIRDLTYESLGDFVAFLQLLRPAILSKRAGQTGQTVPGYRLVMRGRPSALGPVDKHQGLLQALTLLQWLFTHTSFQIGLGYHHWTGAPPLGRDLWANMCFKV
ncbi:hypothetical protein CYLTODRAFT_413149 [Cylindrobasidium torrendii FP15055 ss-10]|uniref:Uncharacterized protein n=1 Tax=Cylindrobasidium torrendii FP15055 ss-10 TaxID=1314674 RepID=A0A0D7B3E7_9AGAR|nr:hypothetical protein CYLTODRAFT_413149 [Cylindrobasidium torrendii FP15055 ss-10]